MGFQATVREWFKTDLRPSQDQFWAGFNFLRWKDEKVPVADIEGIEGILNAKAEAEVLTHHLTDVAAHVTEFGAKEDKNEKGAANGYAPLDEFAKIARQYLTIIDDLVTGGSDALSAEQGKLLQGQIESINILLSSDDINLDTVQELVDAIKTVETSLETILVNDLTTGGVTKALTAEMGKALDLKKQDLLKLIQESEDEFGIYIGKGGFDSNPLPGDPPHMLDVASSSNVDYLVRFTNYSDTGGLANFHIQKARGSESSPTSVLNNDFLASFGFRGYGTTRFQPSSAAIQAIATENFSDTNKGTLLVFEVTPNGVTAPSGRVRALTLNADGSATFPYKVSLAAGTSAGHGVNKSQLDLKADNSNPILQDTVTLKGGAPYYQFKNLSDLRLAYIQHNGIDLTISCDVGLLRIDNDFVAKSIAISDLNTAPASATASGIKGQIRFDANYMYLCVATNSWKRSALVTW